MQGEGRYLFWFTPTLPSQALKRCPEIMDGFQLALHQVHQAVVLNH